MARAPPREASVTNVARISGVLSCAEATSRRKRSCKMRNFAFAVLRNRAQQLLVRERLCKEVVTAAVERSHAVDRVRLRLAEDDDRDVAVTRAACVQRSRVPEQDEIRSSLGVDDVEAVVRQVALEKATRVGLRFGEKQRGRHAIDGNAGVAVTPDVLSRESVTNDLQTAASDDTPKKP